MVALCRVSLMQVHLKITNRLLRPDEIRKMRQLLNCKGK